MVFPKLNNFECSAKLVFFYPLLRANVTECFKEVPFF